MNINYLKRNSTKLLFVSILFKFVVSQSCLFAQAFVQDSLFISIRKSDKLSPPACVIDTILDHRGEHPHFLSNYEVNRYIFVPVDLVIVAERPLTTALFKNLQTPPVSIGLPRFRLELDEFRLQKKSNWLLYHQFVLNASFKLFKCLPDRQPEYAGQLLYESIFDKFLISGKLKNGYESAVMVLQDELAQDLSKFVAAHSSSQPPDLHNLRTIPYHGKTINLHAGVDYIVGTYGTIVDGELLFSHREARKKFIRKGYSVRYRNEKKFDAIEFGLLVDNLFYRLNHKMILKVKSQLLLGVNRWNDSERSQRKLYDALIVDYALSQSITYDPLDHRSFVIGLGLSESINYIYNRGIKLNIGLLIKAGIKL